jgi:hypothetical protein
MTPPESRERNGIIRPADYYSSPASARVLPSWATFGCGAFAVAFLLVIFIGGALVSTNGLNGFFDLVISKSVADLKGQYAADVPAPLRESLDAEVLLIRENLRSGRISMAPLQPFLETMRNVSSDRRVTAGEVERLVTAARAVNASAGDQKKPRPLPASRH